MANQARLKVILPDGNQHLLWTLPGKNLWEVLALAGIDTGGTCGGTGVCKKCKVRVTGSVSNMTSIERDNLLPEELKLGERLACYCRIEGPVTVYLDLGGQDIKPQVYKSTGQPSEYNNQVEIRKFFIPGLDRQAPVPIYERLKESLTQFKLALSVENINDLCSIDRVGRPSLELYATIVDEQVCRISRKNEGVFGIALDLGSTSLFGALVNLETGEVGAICSRANMQRVYGLDIISRISYCSDNPDGLEKLHQILINNINSLIDTMLKKLEISSESIYRFTVVGNPVMLHFLTGLNVHGFAQAPYTGTFTDEIVFPADHIGIKASKEAQIIILPQVGGFVGADTISCLLTLDEDPGANFLLVDIGTNGEVVLFKEGKMWATSAAAGPAFEGGGITCGIRAQEGAIDRVFLGEDGGFTYNVLGDQLVRGICGSAIIDLTASLVKAGYITERGIINPETCTSLNIKQGGKGPEIVLCEAGQSLKGFPIVFNQEDIRQVQLAKGAIRTAIDLLLQEAGLDYKQLDKIYLAGAFGNYLNPENAIITGILPPVDTRVIYNIGNAAAQGAINALMSPQKRSQAKKIKQTVQLVELANRPDFQEKFLGNLDFK